MNQRWVPFLGLLPAACLVVLVVWRLSVGNGPEGPKQTSYLDEPVEVFEERFVGERPVPGLVGPPTTLPRQRHRKVDLVAFTRWFDGEPRFVYGWTNRDPAFGLPSKWRIVRGDLATYEEQPVTDPTSGLALLDARGTRLLVAALDEEHGVYCNRVVALDASGHRHWEYPAPELALKDFAILRDAEGACGIVVGAGGETGLVALDPGGRKMWQVPERYVVYEVHTHESLPGFFLEVGGDSVLYHHDVSGAEPIAEDGRRDYFLDTGLLAPDEAGRPAVFGAGSRLRGSEPVLIRLDVDGRDVWRVRPGSRIAALALVEPPGRERLLVATTRGGWLLVVDEDGMLRARVELPNEHPGKNMATLQLRAGELARGRWAVAVCLLQDAYLYELDLDALDGR